MQQLFHPKKGVLTPSGKKFSPLKGVVPLYADQKGQKHELDGSEVPMEHIMQKQEENKQAKHNQLEQELVDKLDEIDSKFEEAALENEKQAEEEKKDLKHKDILSEIKNASESIVEAVNAIPETVIPEVKIPDHYEEQSKWQDQVLELLKKEIPAADYTQIIEAFKAIKFPEVKIPEPKDYTELLKGIKEALPENTDFTEVVAAIMAIPRFEIPQNLISNDRIKVEVDRIAMPNGGAANLDTSNLATEETLQAVLAASGGSLPYDNIEVDTSNPISITVTKKNGSTVVDTKTINII